MAKVYSKYKETQYRKKSKYRVGQMVYSWQNPTRKARISHISPGEGEYPTKYKLALMTKGGYSHSSKWINEPSIRKVPKTRTHRRRKR